MVLFQHMQYIQEKHCFKQSNYTMYFHRYLVNLIGLLFSEAKYIICLVTFWPYSGTPEAVFLDYTLHGMLASGKMRSFRPCGQNLSSLTKKEKKKRKAKRNLKTHKIVVWLSLFRSEIRNLCNNGKQMIYLLAIVCEFLLAIMHLWKTTETYNTIHYQLLS